MQPKCEPYRAFGQPVRKSANPPKVLAKVRAKYEPFQGIAQDVRRHAKTPNPFFPLCTQNAITQNDQNLDFHDSIVKAECMKSGAPIFHLLYIQCLCGPNANPTMLLDSLCVEVLTLSRCWPSANRPRNEQRTEQVSELRNE